MLSSLNLLGSENEEDERDPADALMQRGEMLRRLREMEQQDELERAATSYPTDPDPAAAINEMSLQQPQTAQEDPPGKDEVIKLPSGKASMVEYESYLLHQRWYDDLKHVDTKFLRYEIKTENDDQPIHRLVIEQDKSLGKGGLCWDAAFILAEHWLYCEAERTLERFSERHERPCRLIELGSGTGLCGMLIASGCYHFKSQVTLEVTCTDLPALLPLMQRNRDRNFATTGSAKSTLLDPRDPDEEFFQHATNHRILEKTVNVDVLAWGCRQDEERHGLFDIVVGADVVATLYDPLALVETISRLCHEESQVFISFKERLSSLHRQFEEDMRSHFAMVGILHQPLQRFASTATNTSEIHNDSPSDDTIMSRNRNPDVHILVASGKKTDNQDRR